MIDLNEFDKEYHRQFITTKDVYNNFQLFSGDINPLHTDAEFAKCRGFPERVMYGNILNGYLSYFVGMMLPSQNVIIHSQSIKFKNPFFMNEILDFSAKIDGLYERINVIDFKYSFTNTNKILIATGKLQIGVLE